MPLIRKNAASTPPPPADPAAVLDALVRGNGDERWTAARACAHVRGGAEALAAALRTETDARVREAMFTSLATIASPASIEAMIAALRTDDANLRSGALDALCSVPQLAADYLPALLQDDDSDVRVLCCEIARGLPGDVATPLLCSLLSRETEANVCAAAVDVLAETGNSQALPALDQCAARFPDIPFLVFAIRVARDRVLAQRAGPND